MTSAGTRAGTALTTPAGLAVVPASRCSYRGPCAHGRRAPQASRRPRGLRKRLQHVKEIAESLPFGGRDYAYAAPVVGPDLKVWAVPQHGEDSVRALGLSLPLNSQKRSRPGLSGISTHGKKQIRHSCRLMEDFRSRTAMWTVTLTDEDYIGLSANFCWKIFQRRICDLLIRYLKAHGDEAIVIGVCEIGSKRFARTGRPDPHIHVLTTGWGKRHPDGGWLLSPDRMDELVTQACQYAGLPFRERPSSSNVSGVKHSATAYMSKYLTKQIPVQLEDVPPEWHSLIPSQWWNQSAGCKAMVEGCMSKLPPAFAAFLVRKAVLLEQMQLGRGGVRTVGWKKRLCHDIPIEVFRFVFKSPEALHQALELFSLWVANDEELEIGAWVMSG